MIEMRVSGVAIDNNNMPIVILKGGKEGVILPIWVGIFEAQSILFALEGIVSPRPLTHDLLCTVVGQMGAKLNKIVINALRDNTYFAKLELAYDSNIIEIDSRPSDAIALALKMSSPIYVADPVLSTITSPQEPIRDEEVAMFKEFLSKLKPGDIIGNINQRQQFS